MRTIARRTPISCRAEERRPGAARGRSGAVDERNGTGGTGRPRASSRTHCGTRPDGERGTSSGTRYFSGKGPPRPGSVGDLPSSEKDPLGCSGPARTQVRVGSSRPRSTTSVGDLRSVGRRPRDVGRRTGGGQTRSTRSSSTPPLRAGRSYVGLLGAFSGGIDMAGRGDRLRPAHLGTARPADQGRVAIEARQRLGRVS